MTPELPPDKGPVRVATPIRVQTPKPRSPRVVRTFGERCERVFLSLPSLWCMGLSTVLLTLWVLLVQLPQTYERRVVSAREMLNETENAAALAAQHETVDQNQLSNQVAQAERFLIPSKEDVIPLVTEVGRIARQCGLYSEMGTSLNSDHSPQIPRVKVLSSLVRVQPLPSRASGETAFYPRLIALLDKLEQMTNKLEVSGLWATSDKSGNASAQLELQFWVRQPHEQTPGQ